MFINERSTNFFKRLFDFLPSFGTHFECFFDVMFLKGGLNERGLDIPLCGGHVDFVSEEEDAGVVAIVVFGLLDPVLKDTLGRKRSTSKLL